MAAHDAWQRDFGQAYPRWPAPPPEVQAARLWLARRQQLLRRLRARTDSGEPLDALLEELSTDPEGGGLERDDTGFVGALLTAWREQHVKPDAFRAGLMAPPASRQRSSTRWH
jgi:hypothetical protein